MLFATSMPLAQRRISPSARPRVTAPNGDVAEEGVAGAGRAPAVPVSSTFSLSQTRLWSIVTPEASKISNAPPSQP